MIYNSNRSGSASSSAHEQPPRLSEARSGRMAEHETGAEEKGIILERPSRIKIINGRAVVVKENNSN